MSQKEIKERFTVVAFRYDQAHSVLYGTVDTVEAVRDSVERALRFQSADVISIRRVYEKRP